MKRKFFLGTFLSILVSSFGFAQGSLGAQYFYVQAYDDAKSYFDKEVSQSQDLATAYYYLGEIAYAKGDLATAKINYEKGLAADPENMLNSVGLTKLTLKADPKAAAEAFSRAGKKDKKDVSVWVAIAYAYLQNNDKSKALDALKEARKADKKSPLIYICEGDIAATIDKDAGLAATNYTQALYFDATNVVANYKLAQVYESTGENGRATAIEELNKVVEKNPNFLPAYKYLGKLYYVSGNYTKTIESYKKYFASALSLTSEDYADFAGAYYFSQDYEDAKTVVNQGLAKFPDDFFLNRILLYVSVDTEDYALGLSAGDKFFSIKKENAKYFLEDYLKYATALAKNERSDEAIAQYKKAIELEPDNIDIYKKVAEAASNSGRPDEAGDLYSQYIAKLGDKAVTSDYYRLGVYYYTAGSKIASLIAKAQNDSTIIVSKEDVAKANSELAKADSAFAKVIELEPDNYLGHLWRARSNSSLDPTSVKGLARPYYESLERVIVTSNGTTLPSDPAYKNLAELKEAYSYLCYYAYLRYEKDKTAANKDLIKQYSEKLLVVDPGNPTATQLLDYVK